jgi:branched-chain amino acid transport system permease protein
LGFTLTFGISGVANFAHGAFYIFAGYFAWMLLTRLGLPYPLVVVLSVVVTALMGASTYWLMLRRTRGLVLSEVIATFGIGAAILELFRWAGFTTYEFNIPYFVEGSVEIAGVTVDHQRLAIVGIALAILSFIWVFTRYTKIGLSFRGMAQDEHTALSLGIHSDRTAMLSVAFGSALAAIAALTILPLGIITPHTGYEILLTALAVAVVGGLESITGAMVASFALGYAQVITATYLAPGWMMIVYLIAILVVLAVRPSGLLGKFKELEERV